MALINTRSDLEAIAGTHEFDEFINLLKGSIYRLERDDVAQVWRVITDTSSIERYGFKLENFADVLPPQVPEYIPQEPEYIPAN